MFEEFVRFVLGRFTIVTRDSDVQIVWQSVAPQSIDLVQNILGNECGVGTLALGERNGHCWIIWICHAPGCSLCAGEHDVAVGFRWAVRDLINHVTQVHRPSCMHSHYDLLHILRASNKVASLDLELLVIASKATGLTARIRGPELH